MCLLLGFFKQFNYPSSQFYCCFCVLFLSVDDWFFLLAIWGNVLKFLFLFVLTSQLSLYSMHVSCLHDSIACLALPHWLSHLNHCMPGSTTNLLTLINAFVQTILVLFSWFLKLANHATQESFYFVTPLSYLIMKPTGILSSKMLTKSVYKYSLEQL